MGWCRAVTYSSGPSHETGCEPLNTHDRGDRESGGPGVVSSSLLRPPCYVLPVTSSLRPEPGECRRSARVAELPRSSREMGVPIRSVSAETLRAPDGRCWRHVLWVLVPAQVMDP